MGSGRENLSERTDHLPQQGRHDSEIDGKDSGDRTGGELVINSAELKGSYTDTGLSNGTTYYYKAFPYSDHYVYNRGASNIGQATPSHTAKVIIIYKAQEAVGGSIEAKKAA